MGAPSTLKSMGGTIRAFDEIFIAGDPLELRTALAADVTFRSPAVFHAYHGVGTVLPVLLAARRVLADIQYRARLTDGDRSVYFFEATVHGFTIEGIDSVVTDVDGRISELTVMIRPLKGLQRVVEEMGRVLSRGPSEVPNA